MTRLDKAIDNILEQINWTPPPYTPKDLAWRDGDNVFIDIGYGCGVRLTSFNVSVLLDVLDPPKKGKK